jgi:hypothetical protein
MTTHCALCRQRAAQCVVCSAPLSGREGVSLSSTLRAHAACLEQKLTSGGSQRASGSQRLADWGGSQRPAASWVDVSHLAFASSDPGPAHPAASATYPLPPPKPLEFYDGDALAPAEPRDDEEDEDDDEEDEDGDA